MKLRQIIMIVLCAIGLLPVVAQQEMSVVEFKELPNDMTAMLAGTQKEDQNGNTAALIKIVTIEHGFTFDGGSLGIVDTDSKPGEIWVYVPQQAQRITIAHSTFGVLRNYTYPVPIVGGRTYEMLLDIGMGRYVTVNASRTASDIFIDGQYVGKSPVYNYYMHYGKHSVRAINGRFEGSADTFISSNVSKETKSVVSVDMKDMSQYYGDIDVTVDGHADIYFANRLVGTGRWRDQLKEGTYEVETRKADCDPVKTQFTVKAQQRNTITAQPPRPHTGWLNVYTRPRNVKVTYNGSHPVDLTEVQTLPVGTYQVEFAHKGYQTLNVEYTIRHNETTRDTVELERITYVKPLAFYFGGAFSLRTLHGITGILGAVFMRHDLQASYTFGIKKSDVVYWNGDMNTGTQYKMNTISVKYGYQFPLMRQLAITPQVGWAYNFLTASAAASGNTTYGNGAASHALSVGGKLVLVPMQHLYFFVAPEYMVALTKDTNFKAISANSNVSANGFAVHAGVLVNF